MAPAGICSFEHVHNAGLRGRIGFGPDLLPCNEHLANIQGQPDHSEQNYQRYRNQNDDRAFFPAMEPGNDG